MTVITLTSRQPSSRKPSKDSLRPSVAIFRLQQRPPDDATRETEGRPTRSFAKVNRLGLNCERSLCHDFKRSINILLTIETLLLLRPSSLPEARSRPDHSQLTKETRKRFVRSRRLPFLSQSAVLRWKSNTSIQLNFPIFRYSLPIMNGDSGWTESWEWLVVKDAPGETGVSRLRGKPAVALMSHKEKRHAYYCEAERESQSSTTAPSSAMPSVTERDCAL